MYSLVLMSAMSATPAAPEFNGFFRDLFSGNCSGCSGCNGCSGAARYSCTGCCGSSSYATNNCCGGSCCGGCCGGSGLFSGERLRSLFQPTSCCGGGCCGGCCGGGSFAAIPSYSGGYSCFGGSMATIPSPGFEAYPSYPSLPGFNVPPPSIPYAPPEAAPSVVPERTSFGPRPASFTATAASQNLASRATVIVRLPADAVLYADGTALKMTGTERKFITPELPAGREFTYKFSAEYERNGEVVTVSKKIAVRPGNTSMVEFADLTATKPTPAGSDAPVNRSDAVAAVTAAAVSLTKTVQAKPAAPIAPIAPIQPVPAVAPIVPVSIPSVAPVAAPTLPASITVTVPAGASLYVDDRKNLSTEPVRRFTTPPLPAGREFAYQFKVEVVRNGLPESVTQRVTFRAGEQLTVDLTNR